MEDMINMRLTPELLRAVDEMRASRLAVMSRSAFIRDLISREFDRRIAEDNAQKASALLRARRESLVERHKPKPKRLRPSTSGCCTACGAPRGYDVECPCGEGGWRGWRGDEWIGRCPAKE